MLKPSLPPTLPEATPLSGRHQPKRGEQGMCFLMPVATTICRSHHCYEFRQRPDRGGNKSFFSVANDRNKMPKPSLLPTLPEATPLSGRHQPERGEQGMCFLTPVATTICRCHRFYEFSQRPDRGGNKSFFQLPMTATRC